MQNFLLELGENCSYPWQDVATNVFKLSHYPLLVKILELLLYICMYISRVVVIQNYEMHREYFYTLFLLASIDQYN